MGATIADIAREAGVSTATVSYALRGDPQVREETAGKVRAAAKRLQYRGNASARSLRLGRSGVIAVAVHDLALAFSGELSSAISRALWARGYQAFVQQTLFTGDTEASLLRELDHQFCDGTIFCSGELSPQEMKRITGDKPLVILDPSSPTDLFDTVYTPSLRGAYEVTRHLLESGCTDIVLLGTEYMPYEQCSTASDVSSARLTGCMEAMRERGIPFGPRNVAPMGPWTQSAGYAATTRMLEEERGMDGLFCLSDTIAVGALQSLVSHGVSVPGEVAVAGFDGTLDGAFSNPPLTTAAVDFSDLAGDLVDLLLRRIESPNIPFETRVADFSLCVRGSTRG
jgi:DNA-binding LacI/PurR family transcriptional regulator